MFSHEIPVRGYILKNWGTVGFRATAVAYLQREGLFTVEHNNGRWYTLTKLKEAMIS